MDATNHPGDAEAVAAIAGMQDVYGRPPAHAVGDSVWFSATVGAMPRQGQVVDTSPHGGLVVRDSDGVTHTITATQIAEF